MRSQSLCIIGGGVVGLGLAGEMADHFDRVILLERNNYNFREASYAAGGMLSPFMEVDFQEEEVLQFNRKSLKLYESFIKKLNSDTEVPLELQSQGSLHVAFDEAQLTDLKRLYKFQKRLNLPVRKLSPDEVKKREPLISDQVQGGLYARDEKHLNNRQLGLALYQRCRNKNVVLLGGNPVKQLHYSGNGSRIAGVETPKRRFHPDTVIVAAGAWSNRLSGLKKKDQMPVRPVKGQALSVSLDDSFNPQCIIRSSEFYGVPHYPERFIIGASMEEKGFESRNTAGELMDLLDAASIALPALKDRNLLEFWSGLRPASRDNRPILGPSNDTDNLYFATGHFRNGILQLPITIEVMKQYLTDSNPSDEFKSFQPARFQQHGSIHQRAS